MRPVVNQPAILIRLRPTGPWRYGAGDHARDRVDALYRSDRLYSAVTLAMRQLGWLEEWLEATARAANPAVAFSSLMPFLGETLFAPPPATLWPPPAALVNASSRVFLGKLRWSAARFVPLTLIESMLSGQSVLADQWLPDAESGCLLRRDRPSSSPFRAAARSGAAVDRLTRAAVKPHSCAGIEFETGSGMWTVARYRDEPAHAEWNDRVIGAFRLLADSGFGGRRSSGWGRAAAPEVQPGVWPALILPRIARGRNGKQAGNGDDGPSLYWLLSIYSPAPADAIDWAQGDYRTIVRGGRIESSAALGLEKRSLRMIAEGSVIASRETPVGAAVDVAPDGFAHPVYRSGIALALRLPEIEPAAQGPVETPGVEESIEEKPCAEATAGTISPESITTEPIVTPPIVTEAVTTEPLTIEPVTTEPVTTEPVTTEPVTTEPIRPEAINEDQRDEI
jgi:CRISPR type III-A-associated RAMP protein Csm4